MKRLKAFLFAMIAVFALTSASAKTLEPIEQSKLFDNTYIEVTVGDDAKVHSWHNNGITSGLRVGKYLTPAFGLEVEFNALFNDFYKNLDAHRLGLNGVLNVRNLGGYDGVRHVFDPEAFVGLGWERNYRFGHTNHLYTTMGLKLNFNTSSHVTLSLIPTLNYVLSPSPIQYNINRADLGVAVGLTYRFGSGFKLCNNKYTQAEYDALMEENAHLAKLLAQKPMEVTIKEVLTETVVETVDNTIFPTVGFECGKYAVLPTNALNIKDIAEYMLESNSKYTLTGYASVEGPELLNQNLSLDRANALKEALVGYGVNPDNLVVVAGGPTTQFGDEYIYNRVVIVEETAD